MVGCTSQKLRDQFGYPVAWTKEAIAGIRAWRSTTWSDRQRVMLDALRHAADRRFDDALGVLDRPDRRALAPSALVLRARLGWAIGDHELGERSIAEARSLDEQFVDRALDPITSVAFLFTMPPSVGMMRVHTQMAEVVSEIGYEVHALVVGQTTGISGEAASVAIKVIDDRTEVVGALRRLAAGRRLTVCTAAWQTYADCALARVGPVIGFSAGDPGMNELDSVSERFTSLMSFAYELPVAMVANTKFVEHTLLERFGRRSSSLPIEIPRRFFDESSSRDEPGPFRVLVVGSPLVRHRNIPTALEAVESLRRKGHAIELSWISPDPVPEAPDWATIYENPPLDDIPGLYASCDALVYASSIEGLGLPPLEAMATGAIVVTSPVGGIVEFCRAGENCLMVPPGDPVAIASSLEMLISRPTLVKDLREGGSRTAAAHTRERVRDTMRQRIADPIADLSLVR